MNNRKRNLYILSIMVIILIAALMTACKTEDITKRAENEEKLLKAMTEYPGNGLYDPAETVILRKSLQKQNRRQQRRRKPGRKP